MNATSHSVDPGRLYSAPSFAFDPDDSTNVIAGFSDLRTRRCGLLRSSDGGTTWTLAGGAPATPSYPFCSHSQGQVIQTKVAYGSGGVIYFAHTGWGTEDTTREAGGILLSRSEDLGETWETAVLYSARDKRGEDEERARPMQGLAVDTTGSQDVVYVTWNRVYCGSSEPNEKPASPSIAVSRDGGRTFDEPIDLAAGVFEDQALRDQAMAEAGPLEPPEETPPAGSLAATPNQPANFGGTNSRTGVEVHVNSRGDALAFWRAGSANFEPDISPAYFISKSTDQGRTWKPFMSRPFGETNPESRFAIGPNDVIHMAYQQGDPDIRSLGDIYHLYSTDEGQTWSEPQVLSDDNPADVVGQYQPNISVAPNGRVDVAWWDTRDDPGIRANDVYYAYSNDDGVTWAPNMRITDQSVDRRFGVWGINYDISSPPGIGSSDELAIFGWDDTRFSRADGEVLADDPIGELGFGDGLQDVFVSSVQFTEVGGGGASSTAKAVLASVIGLVAVGLVLLVAVAMTGGFGGSSSKKSPKKEKAPSKVS